MWQLDHKEGWVPKNWCFWTVVLEKTLESSLDWKETKPVNPKWNQPWIFIGRTDAEAETPILWPPDAKTLLFPALSHIQFIKQTETALFSNQIYSLSSKHFFSFQPVISSVILLVFLEGPLYSSLFISSYFYLQTLTMYILFKKSFKLSPLWSIC